MLEINELRLTAIGRFVDEQVIEFKKLGNLVQVDGLRTDTGGSSGSGKSTVFNSLDYLFGLNDIPSSVLQSRFTKDPITVTMVGAYNGLPLTITRGKGKLTVDLNGEVTSGSKAAEEKIDQILGMPRNLFRPLLHKRQKEGGFFLQFTPKEIHEFLTDALGLGELRSKAETIDAKIKDLSAAITAKSNLRDQANASHTATLNAQATLGEPPVREVTQQTILQLKSDLDACLAAITPIKEGHEAELAQLDAEKPQPKVVQADQSHLQSLEAEYTAQERQIDAIVSKNNLDNKAERERSKGILEQIQKKKVEVVILKAKVANGNTAKESATKAAAEIKKIRESICPTCEQNWATEAAKTRENALLAQISGWKVEIQAGIEAEKQILALNQEISALEPLAIEQNIPMPDDYVRLRMSRDEQKVKINTERARLRDWEAAEHQANRALLEQFNTKRSSVVARHQKELANLTGNAELARRVLDAAVHKMKSFEEAKSRYDSTVLQLVKQSEKSLEEYNKYKAEVEELQAKLVVAEEIKKAIKGYTSVAFDEALEYIGAAATDIIRAIPNMANATIQLEGTKETAAGKIKEEVNAVLSMDGETGIPIKSLSGGERSSVDLAVDLAVIDLLESRSKKGIDVFILDEPFTGLDTVSIEMAIDKLKSLNKRLVIVDHNPEIKQMVESRLLVMRDGLTSKIVQN